jgi:hypothetical protein
VEIRAARGLVGEPRNDDLPHHRLEVSLAVAYRAPRGAIRAHDLGSSLQRGSEREMLLVHLPRPLAALLVEKFLYVRGEELAALKREVKTLRMERDIF